MNTNRSENPVLTNRDETSRFALSLLVALLAVGAIFGAYEITERFWLGDINSATLHTLHMLRGIFSSLIAAILMGWMVSRGLPRLPVTSTLEDVVSLDRRQLEQQRLVDYGRWFIQLRWIAVGISTGLVLTCVWLARLLPTAMVLPLLLTIGLLAGSNALYLRTVHRRAPRSLDLPIQVVGDLIILTILLHFSGGIENPISLFMLLHVIIGGIVLSQKKCYGVAAIGSVLFGGLALLEGEKVIAHYTLEVFPHSTVGGDVHHAAHDPMYIVARVGLQSAFLFLTAYFVTTLADRSRHHKTQLEQMTNRAVAQHMLLERSLETTDTALRVLDRSLQPRWTNGRWNKWFGDDTNNSPLVRELSGEESVARKTLRDGRTRSTELTVPPIAGSPARSNTRILRITTAVLTHEDSESLQVVELAQDITEEKEMQAKVIRAGQLAAVGELAGEVAHEVNNPIAIISAKARLLLSDNRSDLNDHIANELAKIIDLSDRVGRIAQGLLSSSRPSGAARSPLNIRDVMQQSLGMVRERATTLGIEIQDLVPTGLPTVMGNPREIGQVFLNLFLNALDAMPTGGRLTISAATDQQGEPSAPDILCISIEDTGTGITEEVRDKVFQPFFTTKEEGHGTGLGLSICHGLITSHGGQIEVESRAGEGARFMVVLPIHRENHRGGTPNG